MYGAALLLLISYLVWSIWFKPTPLSVGVWTKPSPAVQAGKVPGPTIPVPVKVVPKPAVKKKFPNAPIEDDEEWVDTLDLAPAPNGAIVLTKINTKSGEVTNEVTAKPAPWLAFEGTNAIAAGYEVGTDGAKIPIYYRRGLARMKDVHLIAEVGGKVALDPAAKSEAHIGAVLEYRW